MAAEFSASLSPLYSAGEAGLFSGMHPWTIIQVDNGNLFDGRDSVIIEVGSNPEGACGAAWWRDD
jgi:hypothetical protein